MSNYFKLDRVTVENYRSIERCEVDLGRITFLVGANGSGKTSFIDALAFVSVSLTSSPEQAVRNRRGIHSLLHWPVRLPARFSIELSVSSSDGLEAYYAFQIATANGTAVSVAREECRVFNPDGTEHQYIVEGGEVRGTETVFPAISPDRLFLVNASGLPSFRAVYDFLSGFLITEFTAGGPFAARNSLTARYPELRERHPDRTRMVEEYLRAIAPSFERLDVVTIEGRPWLGFIERGIADGFDMSEVSGGLLHAAMMLMDLFEPPREGRPASLVALEEPEAFLHPAAVRILRDAFLEASEFRQILVTSHSSDLLDDPGIPGEWIRVVHRGITGTEIRPLDSATNSIIRDQLFTAGELLRQGGLERTDGH
ncbi:MAG TPA: AAA family ATPase [Candidatus Acidoferrales bacterium]|nr:AAA family ATPase [Candidatus Acidoferrales bacterium]